MKSIILTIFFIIFIQSCQYRNIDDSGIHIKDKQYNIVKQEISMDSIVGPYLRLDKNKYDFGKIRSKKTPEIIVEFEMENQGISPLVILKVDVSCSCMKVNSPKAPILHREKAVLKVTIDTKNQKGMFNKAIFIKSNAENDIVLIRILGEIQKK